MLPTPYHISISLLYWVTEKSASSFSKKFVFTQTINMIREKHGYFSPAPPPPGFLLLVLCAGQRYSSRASGLNQSDLLSSGGSIGQLAAVGGGGGGVYLPDYSVRQLTDLQIIKVAEINDRSKETCSRKFSLRFQ